MLKINLTRGGHVQRKIQFEMYCILYEFCHTTDNHFRSQLEVFAYDCKKSKSAEQFQICITYI